MLTIRTIFEATITYNLKYFLTFCRDIIYYIRYDIRGQLNLKAYVYKRAGKASVKDPADMSFASDWLMLIFYFVLYLIGLQEARFSGPIPKHPLTANRYLIYIFW